MEIGWDCLNGIVNGWVSSSEDPKALGKVGIFIIRGERKKRKEKLGTSMLELDERNDMAGENCRRRNPLGLLINMLPF